MQKKETLKEENIGGTPEAGEEAKKEKKLNKDLLAYWRHEGEVTESIGGIPWIDDDECEGCQ